MPPLNPASPDDVDAKALMAAVDVMSDEFRTRDVSEHDLMLAAHPEPRHSHYHSFVGKRLAGLAHTKKVRGASKSPKGVLWRKVAAAQAGGTGGSGQGGDGQHAEPDPVREGHYASVRYMVRPRFRRILALLNAEPEIGGVYCRPTNKAVTIVDLHAESPKPLVGVGKKSRIGLRTKPGRFAASIPDRIEHLRSVRARQRRPSRERQFEASLLRHAFANGLQLPGPMAHLCLIYDQWRIDSPAFGRAGVVDLVAVDPRESRLVLIELKPTPDPAALDQVSEYVAYFHRHAVPLCDYFRTVARVMAALYGCPRLEDPGDLQPPDLGLAVWPDGSGGLAATEVRVPIPPPTATDGGAMDEPIEAVRHDLPGEGPNTAWLGRQNAFERQETLRQVRFKREYLGLAEHGPSPRDRQHHYGGGIKQVGRGWGRSDRTLRR